MLAGGAVKVRNGKPGNLVLKWAGEKFEEVNKLKKQSVWSEIEDCQIG
jgi:protein ImuA